MSVIFKESIEVEGANVPFFTYTAEGSQIFEFDKSKCGSPDPMVNAMAGLKLLDTPHKKVVMINMAKPAGLISKVSENYDIQTEKLVDGRVKLTFSYKQERVKKQTCLITLADNSYSCISLNISPYWGI